MLASPADIGTSTSSPLTRPAAACLALRNLREVSRTEGFTAGRCGVFSGFLPCQAITVGQRIS